MFMNTQLQDIAYLIQFKDRNNPTISNVSVAWHLDHSLKVINNIYRILKNSDTALRKKRFNLIRYVFFALGYIPRGRGQSPSSVLPPEKITTEDILSQLELTRENLKEFESLDPHVNFIHPIFGLLNKKQTKRFLQIHTNHHLKIIHDILKKE